jgi:hypothetical protein
MNYIEIENFFEDPKSIIDFSKNLEFYTFDKHPENSVGRYAGKRTLQIHNILPEFFDKLCYDVISNLIDFSKVNSCDWRVSAYFSMINSEDCLEHIKTIHKDVDVLYAGVIYLNKDLDIHSGTTLYDQIDEKYIKKYEFTNKFNKMVIYDASIPHGITKFVDNRLTLLFFIKDLKYSLIEHK